MGYPFVMVPIPMELPVLRLLSPPLAIVLGAAILLSTGAARANRPAPASIQQTMLTKIDPASDALWASVGTVETAHGTQYRAPRNAAQWRQVVGYADTLIAGARHLQTRGLPVGATAHSRLADANTPGTRTAPQIRADIAADPARFARAAHALEVASVSARAAALAHRPEALIEAGAAIDAACEACHAAYWYPRTRPLTLPEDGAFAARAIKP